MTVYTETRPETKSIGMGQWQVTRNTDTILASLGIGSCVAVGLYDAQSKVAGMAHVVLPEGEDKGGKRSAKYADSGITLLLDEMRKLGASPTRIVARIAGGACMTEGRGLADLFNIGSRNVEAVSAALTRHGISVAGADTGGNRGRSVRLHADTGQVTVNTAGDEAREI